MGTIRYGKDYRLKVLTAPATFSNVGGEGGITLSSQARDIDTSSKDDGDFETSGSGQLKISISVDGKVRLPDPGFEQVFDTHKVSGASTEFQIVHEPSDVVIFQCMMKVGGLDPKFSNNEAVPYTFTLSPTEAPTIYDLTAA